jgi:hypothetical protein
LDFLYNIKGLRSFKNKFNPSWWESEYILIPEVLFASPRVANAFAHAILPNGWCNALYNRIFNPSDWFKYHFPFIFRLTSKA